MALDKGRIIPYNNLAIGVWRSLVSRLVRVQEAPGSNPGTPTKRKSCRLIGRIFFCTIHFALFNIHYSFWDRIF